MVWQNIWTAKNCAWELAIGTGFPAAPSPARPLPSSRCSLSYMPTLTRISLHCQLQFWQLAGLWRFCWAAGAGLTAGGRWHLAPACCSAEWFWAPCVPPTPGICIPFYHWVPLSWATPPGSTLIGPFAGYPIGRKSSSVLLLLLPAWLCWSSLRCCSMRHSLTGSAQLTIPLPSGSMTIHPSGLTSPTGAFSSLS